MADEPAGQEDDIDAMVDRFLYAAAAPVPTPEAVNTWEEMRIEWEADEAAGAEAARRSG